MKTIYCLKIRTDDKQPWSEANYYRTRAKRDKDSAMNRIMGGLRTFSYEDKVTKEQFEELTGD